MNPRLTAKDRALLKGAIRRAFARSDLHKQVLERHAIEHYDEKRPRCKKWVWCNLCGQVFPKWCATVDHKFPIVPVDTSFEEMSMDALINRTWCDIMDLQVLDPECHSAKSKLENEERKRHKHERKKLQDPS